MTANKRPNPNKNKMKKGVMRLTHNVIDIFPQSCRKVLLCFVEIPLFRT